MINGTLPNNTVWWISRNEKNVWIESKELENQKFIDKEYIIEKDRIFGSKPRRQVGELTGSKLERRLYKDSWRITLDAFLDIYPDLVSEIKNKNIEEKKKKRQTKSKTEYKTKSNAQTLHQELTKEIDKNKEKEQKDVFDITCPYVEWIKGEIDKSPDRELKILSDDMKEKMGKEYINMHVIRIYLGLNKVLSEIGINVELGKLKGKSALIMKGNK